MQAVVCFYESVLHSNRPESIFFLQHLMAPWEDEHYYLVEQHHALLSNV
jgi:hypothetical protein